MLGLSTHEQNFFILRESLNENFHQNQNVKDTKLFEGVDFGGGVKKMKNSEFQFIKISVLREYLYHQFKGLYLSQGFDFERIVDDFVFLCFFVGNDFLPHLPSLGIREGALDALLLIYRDLLPHLAGYLTNGDGQLCFEQVDVFLQKIAKTEERFFKLHQKNSEFYEKRRLQDE